MDQFVIQFLNAISYGMLLFLLSAGLTLMYGLMGIINLAHGTYFMLAGYIGYSVVQRTDNFLLGVLAGSFSALTLGTLMERYFLRYLHRKILAQVLLTFGFVYIFADISLKVWGGTPLIISTPSLLSGSIDIMGRLFPIYRVAIIFIGLIVAAVLWLFQEKTKIGAIIRAGVDDKEMVSAVGINIAMIFTIVFALGAFIAGFGGVLGGVILGMYPGMDVEILAVALVVIVVGGLGSLRGALLGSILMGLIDVFVKAIVPGLALFALFLGMAVILVVKPSGLLSR